jgi:hypothetical protein
MRNINIIYEVRETLFDGQTVVSRAVFESFKQTLHLKASLGFSMQDP